MDARNDCAAHAVDWHAEALRLRELNAQRANTLTRCRLLAEHWQRRGGPSAGVFAKDLLNVLNGHVGRGCELQTDDAVLASQRAELLSLRAKVAELEALLAHASRGE